MIINKTIAFEMAKYLFSIGATKIQIQDQFEFTSGIRSPIYNDNRICLSYPTIRDFIKEELSNIIYNNFPDTEAIIGVATAGITHGILVADHIGIPFGYVRSETKKHGMEKQVEGDIKNGQKVVVVEDLISTGNSCLNAVSVMRNFGAVVLGVVSIFSYDFEITKNNFENKNCKYISLTDYETVVEYALENKIINSEDIKILSLWKDTFGK